MSWRAPTETDIINLGCSSAELEAYRGVGLAEDQEDPVQAQITAVVDLMRGYFQRCSQHVMGAEGTIPDEAFMFFGDLIVPIIQKRPAGALIDASGIRMDGRKDALKWLEHCAKCDVLFSDSVPATQPDSGPVGSPSICAPRRKRRPRDQDGL